MRLMTRKTLLLCSCLTLAANVNAQSFDWYCSTEGNAWEPSRIKLQTKAADAPDLTVSTDDRIVTFKGWGVTFNELDWDAMNMLTRNEQDKILSDVFSPEGDLRITRGRISMGANDYARSWYSCDEVEGDFELRYFNIERDKRNIIPFIRSAQKYNPDLVCWVSPWCPPSWMKINGDYPVLSSKYNNLTSKTDYLLHGKNIKPDPDEMKLVGKRTGMMPGRVTTTDYMIQDPRYLKAYADMFCKFTDAYKQQGIPIDKVMYQNEAYSYTPYPGCGWTAEGTVRFNKEYLAPVLKQAHPDVKLYLGTFNTNRQDYVEKILADKELQQCISGMGFQWEGRDILAAIRKQHPEWSYICSESECGTGTFDWKAGEHTFELMNHYLGNGCNEYTLWNFILADKGESPWGWKQNALIQVDSEKRTYTYTPEYYAVKHYAHYVVPGSEVMGCKAEGEDKTPILVARTPDGKRVVIAANFNEQPRRMTVKLGDRYLETTLRAHSFNTFKER